ncbi:hypothetical protein [Rhodosalinus sp.]|uniref:hypothetical protein n=1 Tax=Rhodosalinus sp. TaxID=2047741 RepID=UPI003979A791
MAQQRLRFGQARETRYIVQMPVTVRDMIEGEAPTDFRAIERALAAQDDRCAEAEAVLSALILRRRTEGDAGLYGALTSADCARRIAFLAEHLRAVGARRAAAAVRALRARLPDAARSSPGAVLEALDERPDILPLCRSLDEDMAGIAAAIEDYLRQCPDDVLNAQVTRSGPLSRLRRLFD